MDALYRPVRLHHIELIRHAGWNGGNELKIVMDGSSFKIK